MKQLKQLVVAGIGEILWDVLGDDEKLGGAPINFAYHANSLGAKGYAVSSVGDDERGIRAMTELAISKMATDYIRVINGATTGYVVAQVDERGVASYSFPDNVAWDELVLRDESLMLATTADCICFGSLGQRSVKARAAIFSFLMASNPDCLKVFDTNLRQDFFSEELLRDSLAVADVVKLNDDEIRVIADMDKIEGDNESLLSKLVEKYSLKLGVLTCGNKGSILSDGKNVSKHNGFDIEVMDTIGAGDAFTAAVSMGLLMGKELDQINEHANKVASYVCSKQGGMPEVPSELHLR